MGYFIGYLIIGIIFIGLVIITEVRDGTDITIEELPSVLVAISMWPILLIIGIVDIFKTNKKLILIKGKKKEEE